MRMRVRGLFLLGAVCVIPPADAAGVRDFTRTPRGTAVSPAQAGELTLTLTEAALRPVQQWIRTAGLPDASGTRITAFVRGSEAELVEAGQRLRVFSVNSRARMQQGRVTAVARAAGGVRVEATLAAPVPTDGTRQVMEIVSERGPFLSIPNVSIIEEGEQQIVYVKNAAGTYDQRAIETGIQGELYTQVLSGLAEGDQVVSVGSFFIDAESKLKSGAAPAMPGMDHGAMAMDHAAMPAQAGAPAAANFQATMTEPAAASTVKAPLSMIHITFNGPVDPAASGVALTTIDGKPVSVGAPMLMGQQMLMAVPNTPLPAGSYKVKWHAAGPAGKKAEGDFAFTVR